MSAAFNAGEPQGSSPIPASKDVRGVTGVSPDLDRLELWAKSFLGIPMSKDRAADVLTLVDRVRVLEAALKEIAWMEERWEVAESADELDFTAWFWEAVAGARAALAVLGGDRPPEDSHE